MSENSLEPIPFVAAQAFNAANAALRQGQLGMVLARCLVQHGQWTPAREAFAACLRLQPTHYSAWLEAGHLYRHKGSTVDFADETGTSSWEKASQFIANAWGIP
jgi:hypothetical protein